MPFSFKNGRYSSRKHQGHRGGLHVGPADRRSHQLLADPGLQHAGAVRLRVDELQAQRPAAAQGAWTKKPMGPMVKPRENMGKMVTQWEKHWKTERSMLIPW